MFGFGKNGKTENNNEETVPGLGKIKNIIAVASGKGGVGKSTVATNLAVALCQQGLKIGLLDADLYGPSQPRMMGGREAPKAKNGHIIPNEKFGVRFISMGLIQPDQAVIVRAPIAIKAISQFLSQVLWGELDYLLIDLPPGTGDIQLSLAQQARLSGAIIVTTPQKMAVEIAIKGAQMFEVVNVPILGIVENMSGLVCSHCQQTTEVFKGGGGVELAKKLEVPFLGAIPLDPEIMMSGDDGVPILEKSKTSHAAKAYLDLAKNLLENLQKVQVQSFEIGPGNIKLHEKDGSLEIEWKDGSLSSFDAYSLRVKCPCATCVDENSGKRILNPASVSLNIQIKEVKMVGRYGLSLQFSDGHGTGIYKFKNLKEENREVPSMSV